ncbi:hypothetical protein BIW11_04314 [Tropilaelaps mercedesae]|nr:hypothetical protein BIW11_04314 [Tropilaelaps mercedesae]
MKGRYN